ncbi:hypothetical protein GCM10010968_15800 [Agrococcus terreus]|uniref:Uncharacterized protein n=1 Tax=Agrococcus terreus TaxID=574649 RepID=A0ABQ2KJ41_9MICO|nr:hypothetical protein GCM10010968_15800 [Agrococcus terreus]
MNPPSIGMGHGSFAGRRFALREGTRVRAVLVLPRYRPDLDGRLRLAGAR